METLKHFNKEIFFFIEKIKRGEPYSIVRVGDGEMFIIENKHIDLSQKFNGEHVFDPENIRDQIYRKILIESFQYRADNYYVGIPCPCCVGRDRSNYIKIQSKLPTKNLTWANIFVNSNYSIFKKEMLPLFDEIIMISHEKSSYERLPFKVKKFFKVGGNSWVNNFNILEDIKSYIEQNASQKEIFLFAAGVLSNMLIYELHKFNPNNFYLDIGSTLDVDMGLGATRKYLKGADTLKKVCIW